MRDRPLWVHCPTCGGRVGWVAENTWKPFCSERCKLIDLGEWAAERYRVPVSDDAASDELDHRRAS